MKIGIVIPTYNEKENISPLINKCLNLSIDCKIIVIDDNSPDGTALAVEEFTKKYPDKVFLIKRNKRGRGSAGICGFKFATGLDTDYIIEMDADLSHNPEDIPRFLKYANENDLVIGSRYIEDGKEIDRNFARKLISRFANFYISTILGLNVKDCSGGFRCYKKDVLIDIDLDSLISSGPSIVIETLYKIKKKNYKIKEIPINFFPRKSGKSKLDIKILIESLIMPFRFKTIHR